MKKNFQIRRDHVRDIIRFPCGNVGKEMFLGSVKEAAEYGANALMVYTGAPQNTRRKEIGELRLDEGLAYAEKQASGRLSFMPLISSI